MNGYSNPLKRQNESPMSLSSPPSSSENKSKKNHNFSLFQRLSASANILKEAVSRHKMGALSVETSGNGGSVGDIYYEDNFNDLQWKCSFGTAEDDGIWMNRSEVSGIIMATMVWIMICKYSFFSFIKRCLPPSCTPLFCNAVDWYDSYCT